MGTSERPPSLSDLDERLKKARRDQQDGPGPAQPRLASDYNSLYGAAWRMSVELIAGLLVGAAIGWLLDRWFGTWPWLFVAFFLLGGAAGLKGMIRTAREMNEHGLRDRHDGDA